MEYQVLSFSKSGIEFFYIDGPGDCFGFYSIDICPANMFTDKQQAEQICTMINTAHEYGKSIIQNKIKAALGVR